MMTPRLVFWTTFTIAVAGVGYYAHIAPGFSKATRAFLNTESVSLQRVVDTSKSSLKQTHFFASVAREKAAREEALLGTEKARSGPPPPPQPKAAAAAPPQAKKAAAPTPPQPQPRAPQATSITPPPRPTPQSWEHYSIGQRIAHGHAFARYGFELGFHSEAEMADHIDRVIRSPDGVKSRGGRTYYWDNATQSVVILDDYLRDGGTAFKPFDGKAFFDKQ